MDRATYLRGARKRRRYRWPLVALLVIASGYVTYRGISTYVNGMKGVGIEEPTAPWSLALGMTAEDSTASPGDKRVALAAMAGAVLGWSLAVAVFLLMFIQLLYIDSKVTRLVEGLREATDEEPSGSAAT
jgi:hypothetical protein